MRYEGDHSLLEFSEEQIDGKKGLYIELIQTEPPFRKTGRARSLLRNFLRRYKNRRIFLDVFPLDKETSFEGLEAFYISEGFFPVTRDQNGNTLRMEWKNGTPKHPFRSL